jgi:hypothetical protein
VRSVVNNVHQVEQKIVPVHKIDVQRLMVKDSQVFLVAFGGYKKAHCEWVIRVVTDGKGRCGGNRRQQDIAVLERYFKVVIIPANGLRWVEL